MQSERDNIKVCNNSSIITEAIKEAVYPVKLEYDTIIRHLVTENKRLSEKCFTLDSYIRSCRTAYDNLEQYSRRNNVRISGISETQREDTDQLVLQIVSNIGVDIALNTIDRFHRVGRKHPKDIIVKFVSYRDRRSLFANRKKLSTIDDNTLKDVYINDDLTAFRNTLFLSAISHEIRQN